MNLEFLNVTAGDLMTGHYYKPGSIYYFPELGWQPFVDTMRLIRSRPEADSHNWPMYPLWMQACAKRFADEPDAGPWTWPNLESGYRRMVASYEKHGYAMELGSGGEVPITVAIEADGKMPVLQGHKRAALIRAFIGTDYPMTVYVSERNADWVALKQAVVDASGGKTNAYHPLPHPEFRHWPVTQPCEERWAMIQGTPGSITGKVLDLGCHTGWFCRMFAEGDAWVVGIEGNAALLDVARAVGTYRDDAGTQPQYINSTIEDYLAQTTEQFDVCLCLSVAMHLFAKLGHDGGWAQLRRVSQLCNRMYLDIAFGGYSQYLPFTPETIADEIIAHTEFTTCRLLGRTAHENRPFYLFEKEQT